MAYDLAESERTFLLNTARRAIESGVAGEPFQAYSSGVQPCLQEKRGVFVSLHMEQKLRGCIGYTRAIKPLYDAVIAAAQSAAFEDPRFSSVTREEVERLDIEISVLTTPAPVDSINDIVLGKHGVIMKKSGLQALFLPQVAIEQKWDLTTTLEHLAMKVGLGPDGWREGAQFEVFEALVFGEERHGAYS